jgi:two-component system alkaline phosphatase synthesis response regulator PhoP
MARILVVDDDKKIVRLVRSYLEQANFQVLTAYDGETALHMIRRDRPDLIVLDLMLPDRDGWEITRLVRSDPALAKLPIVMLTARVEDTDKIIGLELGADDYIAKPFNPREVVARVRAVLRRATDSPVPPQTLQVGELSLDLERHRAAVSDEPIELTPTEFDLLRMMMEHPGRAFTRLELIEKGLGYAYSGMERTIDAHIKNLRKKIGVDSEDPAYIETIYGVGYRLRGDG